MKGINMPTITVTAPDSAMAMDEVVRQLGSEAYILSTSHQDGLVQIKASLDPLNSSPRRPKAIQTVFEKEMEKQFYSFPKVQTDPAKDGIKNPVEKLSEQIVEQDSLTTPGKQAARIEPSLKIVPSQAKPGQDTREEKENQSIEARVTKLEQELKLISPFGLEEKISKEGVLSAPLSSSLTHHSLVQLGFDRNLIHASMLIQSAQGLPTSNTNLIAHLSKQMVAHEAPSTLDADVILVVGPSGSGKTTLSAKFASMIHENTKTRGVKFVSLANINRPHSSLLRHYAKLLDAPISRWSISRPKAWRPIESNTIQIIDVACTTNEIIEIWPELQAHFGDHKVQVIMAIPSGLATDRLSNELDKATELNAHVVLTKLDEFEFSIPEFSKLLTKAAKVGWLAGSTDLKGNLAKATSQIMEQHLQAYAIEPTTEVDNTSLGKNS